MKHIFLIFLIFVVNLGFSQVDNIDLLTNNIKSKNIKSITKYSESKEFINGEIEFKLEFNKEGKLLTIEEYKYPMGPDNPIIMKQEIKYNEKGNIIAYYIKSPDGRNAIDTLIYNDKDEYIQKQRIINGEIVKIWENPNNKNGDEKKEFDSKGNIVKLIESEVNYTIYKYDSSKNLIQEKQFVDGKENTKNIFQYDKKGRLISMKVYLLYIRGGKRVPLVFFFRYEEYE